ncbi:hypothetical protein ACH5RR_023044 [Cinchona calisaya]|uniref:F-box domain-containing protein n=1 Tax=Cinchona calisaya TaxID=153742 RepID=A0ABD2ZCQ9_9GENT
MANEESQNPENNRSWANLPVEILRVIRNKLQSSTLIRFRAVCKRWSQTGNEKRRISNLPWPIVNTCKRRLTEKLPRFIMKHEFYDPHEGKTHQTYFEIPESSSYLAYNSDLQYNSRVLASKKGWVLVEEESPVSRIINLYNPFVNDVIPLPGTFCHEVDAANFSGSPTSPDCVFFMSFHCNRGRTHIGTYRFADEDWIWSTYAVPVLGREDDVDKVVIKSMVYNEGEAMLYFVFQDGTLGSFDFLEKKWNIFWGTEFDHPIESVHLVEAKGEILLATCIVNQEEDNRTRRGIKYDCHWNVYWFDRSCWSWVSQWLEGWTLFVSDASFLLPTSEVGEDLDGCVCYFFRNMYWRIYSLRDEWYILPESLGWNAVEGSVIEESSKAEVGRKYLWIEPPYTES